MKIIKHFILASIFLSGVVSMSVYAADPCEVVLCMYGKATDNSGGEECTSPEKAFFSINALKKKGRFDPTKTADMRKGFLGDCATANPSDITTIISKFGRMR